MEFLAFTFLVFQWAALIHFAMFSGSGSPFAKLKVPFAITNAIQFTVIIALFLALASTPDPETQIDIAKAGTIIMVVFAMGMCIAFAVYGHLLAKVLATGSKESAVRRSIVVATMAFPACFTVTSILAIVAVTQIDDFQKQEAAQFVFLYLFDVIALMALLWVFRRGVDALNPNKGKQVSTDDRSTTGSKTGSSKTGSSKNLKHQDSVSSIGSSKVGRDTMSGRDSVSVSTAEGVSSTGLTEMTPLKDTETGAGETSSTKAENPKKGKKKSTELQKGVSVSDLQFNV
jgi:hypothetical protein